MRIISQLSGTILALWNCSGDRTLDRRMNLIPHGVIMTTGWAPGFSHSLLISVYILSSHNYYLHIALMEKNAFCCHSIVDQEFQNQTSIQKDPFIHYIETAAATRDSATVLDTKIKQSSAWKRRNIFRESLCKCLLVLTSTFVTITYLFLKVR